MPGNHVEMITEHDHGRPYLHCDCGETFVLYDHPEDIEIECRLIAVIDDEVEAQELPGATCQHPPVG